jgi:hypothetical protein
VIGIALAVLLIAGLVLNGLRLRGRAAALPTLPADDAPAEEPAYRAIVAEGVRLDDPSRRAATAYACRQADDIVDLIPRDLPVTAARDLVRHMSPPDAGGPGNGLGPGSALLVVPAVLERAQVPDPGAIATADLIGLARRIKHSKGGRRR